MVCPLTPHLNACSTVAPRLSLLAKLAACPSSNKVHISSPCTPGPNHSVIATASVVNKASPTDVLLSAAPLFSVCHPSLQLLVTVQQFREKRPSPFYRLPSRRAHFSCPTTSTASLFPRAFLRPRLAPRRRHPSSTPYPLPYLDFLVLLCITASLTRLATSCPHLRFAPHHRPLLLNWHRAYNLSHLVKLHLCANVNPGSASLIVPLSSIQRRHRFDLGAYTKVPLC